MTSSNRLLRSPEAEQDQDMNEVFLWDAVSGSSGEDNNMPHPVDESFVASLPSRRRLAAASYDRDDRRHGERKPVSL